MKDDETVFPPSYLNDDVIESLIVRIGSFKRSE